MIALRLNPICRSSPSSDTEAQSPDPASGDVIFILVISRYFKYHLFKSILIGIAHDGSATASNFTGTLAQTGFITVEKVIERLDLPATARRDINKLDESGKLKSPQWRRGHQPAASTLDADEHPPGAESR